MSSNTGSNRGAYPEFPRPVFAAGNARAPEFNLFVRWAFAAFVFSIPFESINVSLLGIQSGAYNLSKILGYLLAVTAVVNLRVCFREFPNVLWYFMAYVGLYSVMGWAMKVPYEGPADFRPSTYVQMLVLFWICYNLFRAEQLRLIALWALGGSCALLSLLQFFGITSVAYVDDDSRMSAFAEDPTTLGAIMALGIVTLLGLGQALKRRSTLARRAAWILVPLIAIALVRTGSRGSYVALGAGVIVLTLGGGSLKIRVRNAVIAGLVCGLLVLITVRIETTRDRWLKTIQDRNFSDRDIIAVESWHMFLEKPLIGWGPVANHLELGRRFGVERLDMHNLYLWALTECGLIGAIPFFIGMGYCILAAWRAGRSINLMLPLALIATDLTVNLNLTWHNRKLHWLILAYGLASGANAIVRGRRPNRFSRPRRLPEIVNPASSSYG